MRGCLPAILKILSRFQRLGRRPGGDHSPRLVLSRTTFDPCQPAARYGPFGHSAAAIRDLPAKPRSNRQSRVRRAAQPPSRARCPSGGDGVAAVLSGNPAAVHGPGMGGQHSVPVFHGPPSALGQTGDGRPSARVPAFLRLLESKGPRKDSRSSGAVYLLEQPARLGRTRIRTARLHLAVVPSALASAPAVTGAALSRPRTSEGNSLGRIRNLASADNRDRTGLADCRVADGPRYGRFADAVVRNRPVRNCVDDRRPLVRRKPRAPRRGPVGSRGHDSIRSAGHHLAKIQAVTTNVLRALGRAAITTRSDSDARPRTDRSMPKIEQAPAALPPALEHVSFQLHAGFGFRPRSASLNI